MRGKGGENCKYAICMYVWKCHGEIHYPQQLIYTLKNLYIFWKEANHLEPYQNENQKTILSLNKLNRLGIK
jgi:hypothetical protein